MAFRFRKSVKVGPLRLTASKSGLSYSVGTKGARITKTASGKTRASFSVPGTGVGYSTQVGGKKKAAAKAPHPAAATAPEKVKRPAAPLSPMAAKVRKIAIAVLVLGFLLGIGIPALGAVVVLAGLVGIIWPRGIASLLPATAPADEVGPDGE